MSNVKDVKVTIRLTQEQFNFLSDLFPSANTSESIRFAVQMLQVLVDRGFYCKMEECEHLEMSDNHLNTTKSN